MNDLLQNVIPTHQIKTPIRNAVSVEDFLKEIQNAFPGVLHSELRVVALQHGVILISDVRKAIKSGRDLRTALKFSGVKKKKVRKNKNPI